MAAGALFQAFQVIEFWFNARVQAKYNGHCLKTPAFLRCARWSRSPSSRRGTLVAFAWVGTFEVLAGAATLVAFIAGAAIRSETGGVA